MHGVLCTPYVAFRVAVVTMHGVLCTPYVTSYCSLCEAGGLEFGCLQELAEVRNTPMAFVSTVSYERQGCGRWVALGRELDLKRVRLGAVESAVVHSSDLAYLPYEFR